MSGNPLADEVLTDLLKVMQVDIDDLHKQAARFDYPPYTDALLKVKTQENAWMELGLALKEIVPNWMQHVGYLMELENKRVREEKEL